MLQNENWFPSPGSNVFLIDPAYRFYVLVVVIVSPNELCSRRLLIKIQENASGCDVGNFLNGNTKSKDKNVTYLRFSGFACPFDVVVGVTRSSFSIFNDFLFFIFFLLQF